MTECIQSSFGFAAIGTRDVEARFDGGQISSDGGAVLLRETNTRLNLLRRFAGCFIDGRSQERVAHTVLTMVSQRVYGLALGYEDLNDHDQLRNDPMFGLLSGKKDPSEALAGKSTLNRLELGTGIGDRYKKITFWRDSVDELLVNIFLEAHSQAPERIVLDIDTTDMELHGNQEARFFHGYYDHYCYLPLYVFCGDHVLSARLQEASKDAASGSVTEIKRIVEQIRKSWPEVKITVRGDSGFCRDTLISWCEENEVDFLIGLARNTVLLGKIEGELNQARQQWEETQKPARVFAEFMYETKSGSWSKPRRVVAKAEHIDGKQNPRFIVTSLSAEQWPAQKLYEQDYCGRGDMENRIKEQFSLFADRVSAETMRANQMRVYFSVIAYVLVSALRRLGLKGTELATAQVSTIRIKLFKIGAKIRITARKFWISMSSAFPEQEMFAQVLLNLRR